jgi:hypothetical protein
VRRITIGYVRHNELVACGHDAGLPEVLDSHAVLASLGKLVSSIRSECPAVFSLPSTQFSHAVPTPLFQAEKFSILIDQTDKNCSHDRP